MPNVHRTALATNGALGSLRSDHDDSPNVSMFPSVTLSATGHVGPVRSGDSADHERQCDLALVSITVTLAIQPCPQRLVGWGQQGRFNINRDRVAFQVAALNGQRKLVANLSLDQALEWPSTERRIESLGGQRSLCLDGDVERETRSASRCARRCTGYRRWTPDRPRWRPELDDVVDAVDELRTEEIPGFTGKVRCRSHDIAEINRPALAIGEPTVVEQLQQRVEDIGVGLDLVEQNYRVRTSAHRFGELSALVIADIPRRGTDQPADAVLLHVLRHVDADHRAFVVKQELSKRASSSVLPIGPRKKNADRAVRIGKPGSTDGSHSPTDTAAS